MDDVNDDKNVKTKPTKNVNKVQTKRQGVKKPRPLQKIDESGAEDSIKDDSVYDDNDKLESEDSDEGSNSEEIITKPNLNKQL